MEISDRNGVYKLKITKGILKKYLSKLDLSTNNLDRVSIRLLVLRVIKDFLDKKLKVDDLTYITTQLFYEIKTPSWFDYDNELFGILSDTTEASWYFWRDKEKYREMINSLRKYYSKNKKV